MKMIDILKDYAKNVIATSMDNDNCKAERHEAYTVDANTAIIDLVCSKMEWKENQPDFHVLYLGGKNIEAVERSYDSDDFELIDGYFSRGDHHHINLESAKTYCEQQARKWVTELLKETK